MAARTRYLSDGCKDEVNDFVFASFRCVLDEGEAERFFQRLYLIIDAEIARAVEEVRQALLRGSEN